MPDPSETSWRTSESHSPAFNDSEEAGCTLSRCDSSGSIATDPAQAEKSWGCSNSLDTTWTDSKHSSYLDFMEANFVQNMYARCYCEEDLCGGVPYQHSHGLLHQGQNQSIETVEENDYYSAESTNRSQRMMQIAMYDFGKWNWRNVMGLKSPTASTRILLENPWVQHFRAGYSPTRSQVCTSSKNDGAKGIKRSRSGIPPAPGPLHSHQMGHNITEEGKSAAVAGVNTDMQKRDNPSNLWPDSKVNEGDTTKKRNRLWFVGKQVPRTRKRTDNYVRDAMTYKQDTSASAPDAISDCV